MKQIERNWQSICDALGTATNTPKETIKNAYELSKQNTEMLHALKEIVKGEGRYSMDALEHASNTVVDMKAIAEKAISDLNF